MSGPKSKFEDNFHEYFRSGRLAEKPELDGDSMCSVAMTMLRGDVVLAKGTGFFWRHSEGVALVTAWHNLSGLHHTTRKPLHSLGGLPDRVAVRYVATEPKAFSENVFPLYIDDDMHEPRWFVHGQCGNYFDIAFLLLTINGGKVHCVNDRFTLPEGRIEQGAELFVVGFPQGISTFGVIPIWKRGSLASEMRLPTEGHPKFVVDAAGRSGLSGAPVYRVQRGVIAGPEPGQFALGTQREFLGLYSGRLGDQSGVPEPTRESSDLGTVWRADIVQEVIATGVPDEKPEVGKGVSFTPLWETAPKS